MGWLPYAITTVISAIIAIGGYRLFTVRSDQRRAKAVADTAETEAVAARYDLAKLARGIYTDLGKDLGEEVDRRFRDMEERMAQARREVEGAQSAQRDAEASSALLLTQLQMASQKLALANAHLQDQIANSTAERRAMQSHLDEQDAEIARLRDRIAVLEREAAQSRTRRVTDPPDTT